MLNLKRYHAERNLASTAGELPHATKSAKRALADENDRRGLSNLWPVTSRRRFGSHTFG